MSPSSPIAGPSAVRAAGPASNDQATATSSIARAPAIRGRGRGRGRGRAPTGDGPETAPSHKQVSFNQWVKIIKISTGGVPSSRVKALDPLCLPAVPRSLAGPIAGPSSARVAAASAATPVVAAHINANPISRRPTVAPPPLRLVADQPIGRHLAARERVHRAPCNNAPESSQAAKRRRVDMRVSDSSTAADTSRTFYDVSGEQVTSERLLVVFGASPYISLGYVLDTYRYIYGCELMPRTLPPHECIATLAKVVALEHWAPHLEGEDSEDIAGRNILCRRDLELGALRQNYREQLGLANDPNAAVLGPRLCYVIVKMCSMSVDLLTGPMLRSIFMDVVGLHLQSISIVTEKRVQRMGANSICHMVESWVGNLSKFITEDFSTDDARSAATQCNAAYTTRCGSASDSTDIALDMLKKNEDESRLFLGNQAADLEEPSKRLLFVASGNTSPLVKVGLEQLAMLLRVQASSS
ncbi:hypothetical protein H4S04_008258 [Coemansia sp. S16]|nr:hypothetical protein H4S04_008258 [Coemansia sp. S16]KAJ2056461.1 hypothetical protein GGH13_007554 [Coemansia sp. S155-1]